MTRMSISRSLIGSAVVLAALVAFAQTQKRILLVDKESNVEITGYTGFNVKYLGDGRSKIVAPGNPLLLTWTRNQMTLKTPLFEGFVRQGKGQALELESATMPKGFDMDLKRASSLNASKELQTIHIDAGSGGYESVSQKVTVNGGAHFDRKDPAAKQDMTLKGASGSFNLYAADRPEATRTPLRAATLTGSVVMTMKSVRKEKDVPIETNIRATSDKLTYDDMAGTITLTGNVLVKGNDPALYGEITADRVTFTLDKAGNVNEIDVDGSPAISKIETKPRSGGGGR